MGAGDAAEAAAVIDAYQTDAYQTTLTVRPGRRSVT